MINKWLKNIRYVPFFRSFIAPIEGEACRLLLNHVSLESEVLHKSPFRLLNEYTVSGLYSHRQ